MQRTVHDRIHLITQLSELHHTVYIELYPGPYRDKCWCSDSVFLTEEAFAFVEPIFRRHTPDYDYYSFMELPRIAGAQVIAELTGFVRAIRGETLVAPLTPSAARGFRAHRPGSERGTQGGGGTGGPAGQLAGAGVRRSRGDLRPGPLTRPMPGIFLTAAWRHLLMLNYEMDPALLQPLVAARHDARHVTTTAPG